MKILVRILAILFGAILFSVIVPVVYYLSFNQFLFDSFTGIALLVGIGFISGGILGAIFPRVFGYIFTFFLDA
jgi:hypothetical protein